MQTYKNSIENNSVFSENQNSLGSKFTGSNFSMKYELSYIYKLFDNKI